MINNTEDITKFNEAILWTSPKKYIQYTPNDYMKSEITHKEIIRS